MSRNLTDLMATLLQEKFLILGVPRFVLPHYEELIATKVLQVELHTTSEIRNFVYMFAEIFLALGILQYFCC